MLGGRWNITDVTQVEDNQTLDLTEGRCGKKELGRPAKPARREKSMRKDEKGDR